MPYNLTASLHQLSPARWKGLKEPTIERPRAARRMAGLDAMEFNAIRIPKTDKAYVIPPLRDGYTAGPAKIDDLPPPVKKHRIEDLLALEAAANRPRDSIKNCSDCVAPHHKDDDSQVSYDDDKYVALKRARIDESLERTVSKEAKFSIALLECGDHEEETEATTGEPEESDPISAFDSLIFVRVKNLCKEHNISVPKASAKEKSVFVSILAAKFPNASDILATEPLESYMKETLAMKCRALGLSEAGSKPKLVQRLKEAGK